LHAQRKPPTMEWLIGQWVKEQAVRLVRLGYSYEDIAHELTLAGLGRGRIVGKGPDGKPIPLIPIPEGLKFPPGYTIGKSGVWRAFKRAMAKRLKLEQDELLGRAGERLDLMYQSAVPLALRGDPRSIRTAIFAVEKHAKILGYASPTTRKHELAGPAGRPLFTDFLASVDKFREEAGDGES